MPAAAAEYEHLQREFLDSKLLGTMRTALHSVTSLFFSDRITVSAGSVIDEG